MTPLWAALPSVQGLSLGLKPLAVSPALHPCAVDIPEIFLEGASFIKITRDSHWLRVREALRTAWRSCWQCWRSAVPYSGYKASAL